MHWRTRRGCSLTERNEPTRTLADFVFAIHLGLVEANDDKDYQKKLNNWRMGKNLPESERFINNICFQLFGDDARLADWRADLCKAFQKEQREKSTPTENSDPIYEISVPRPTPYFIGRGNDVESLVSALLSPELPSAILVQGGPGVGKTELTKAVAHHVNVAERFAERRWLIRLEATRNAEMMKDSIIRALDCDLIDGFQGLLLSLRDKRTLLVLDNLETPWEPLDERGATEETLADLAAVPGVSIIASFRGQEAVGNIRWVPHLLNALAEPAAAELFRHFAGEWVSRDPYLDRFIQVLGAVPLAIELVARRAHGRHSLAPLWQEWCRVGSDLAKRPGVAETSGTSLSYSIAISLRSPRLKSQPYAMRLFALLGRMPSGLAATDIKAVIGEEYSFEAIECLCHLGLSIERADRVDLLPPIREYAARHTFCEPTDLAGIVDYLFDLLTEIASDDSYPLSHHAWPRVIANAANIEACLIESIGGSRHVDRVCDTFIIELFEKRLISGAIMEDFADYLGRMGAFARRGNILLPVAETSLYSHDRKKAWHVAGEALQAYSTVGDTTSEAGCREILGRIALADAQHDRARHEFKTALSLCGLGSEKLRANCLKGLGLVSLREKKPDEAHQLFMSAMSLFEEISSHYGVVICYMCLGQSASDRLDLNGAHRAYTSALEIRIAKHIYGGIDLCLEALGNIAEQRGDVKLALSALSHALDAMKANYLLDEAYLISLCDVVLTPALQINADLDKARALVAPSPRR